MYPVKMAEIYSEKIEVECEGEPLRPVSFTWRGEMFLIKKIVRMWQDWGFAGGAPRKRTWRLRRHRNYFDVETESGRIFEIYLDRKGPELEWIIYREL